MGVQNEWEKNENKHFTKFQTAATTCRARPHLLGWRGVFARQVLLYVNMS